MCNWFKKLFGGKCHCGHCESCRKKKENKQPAANQPMAGTKPEANQPTNVEKPL